MGIAFLTITIALLSVAQIAQKVASRTIKGTDGAGTALHALLRSWQFWLAGLLLAMALGTWLCTLTVFELSQAYPFLSISYVLAALFSRLLLNERIGRTRWLGLGLISAGVAIMLSH